MDIDHELHLAYAISSDAHVETPGSLDDIRATSEELDVTCVPIPLDDRYYDRSDDELKQMDPEQYIDEDAPIVEVLRRMQRQPFLLIDLKHYGYEVKNGELRENLPNGGIGDLYTAAEAIEEHPEVEDRVVERESERYRIITTADLNRREVKSMLYMLVGELESKLAGRIRAEYDSEDLVSELSDDTVDYWKRTVDDGLEVHIVDRMYLKQMKQVFEGSETLIEASGFADEAEFDEQLSGLVELRNKVMHPTRTLVRDRDDIERLVDRVNRVEGALRKL